MTEGSEIRELGACVMANLSGIGIGIIGDMQDTRLKTPIDRGFVDKRID
jgi:hypothetical protein